MNLYVRCIYQPIGCKGLFQPSFYSYNAVKMERYAVKIYVLIQKKKGKRVCKKCNEIVRGKQYKISIRVMKMILFIVDKFYFILFCCFILKEKYEYK